MTKAKMLFTAAVALVTTVVVLAPLALVITTPVGPSGKAREAFPEHLAAVLETGPRPSVHQTADPDAPPRVRLSGHRHRLFFNLERVYGPAGTDDWEPSLAVDPSDSSWVYQAVTRYGATQACSKCPSTVAEVSHPCRISQQPVTVPVRPFPRQQCT